MEAIDSHVVLVLQTERERQELWRFPTVPSTEDGAVRLKSSERVVRPDGTLLIDDFSQPTRFGNELVFAFGNDQQRVLWRTDGSVAGTVPVRHADEPLLDPRLLGTFGDDLLFHASSRGEPGNWSLSPDGTTAALGGQLADKEILAASHESLFIRQNDEIQFHRQGSARVLWKSTLMVKQVERTGDLLAISLVGNQPGDGAFENIWTDGNVVVSQVGQRGSEETPPLEAHVLESSETNGTELLTFDDGQGGAIWSYDPRTDRLREVFQRYEKTWSSNPEIVARIGEQLVFRTERSDTGNALWATAGTGAEPLLAQLDGQKAGFYQVGDGAFFSRVQPDRHELWFTDGTNARLLEQVPLSPDSPLPRDFTVAGNDVYFLANERELWKSDLQGADAELVTDKVQDIASMTAVGESVYFVAVEDGERGIWVSDGTFEGTVAIATFDGVPEQLVAVDGQLMFVVRQGREFQLWKSGGTADSTEQISMESYSFTPRSLAAAAVNGVYTLVYQETFVPRPIIQVLVTDGTPSGTSMTSLEGRVPQARNGMLRTNQLGDLAAFVVTTSTADGVTQPQSAIWMTDGQTPPQQIHSANNATHMISAGKDSFYVAESSQIGVGIRTEITKLGRIVSSTREFRWLDSSGSFFVETQGNDMAMQELGNRLYFVATDREFGSELRRINLDPLLGDANGDDQVDFTDFLHLSQAFGRAHELAFSDGDFNLDGRVDFADFVLLSENFGQRRGD